MRTEAADSSPISASATAALSLRPTGNRLRRRDSWYFDSPDHVDDPGEGLDLEKPRDDVAQVDDGIEECVVLDHGGAVELFGDRLGRQIVADHRQVACAAMPTSP